MALIEVLITTLVLGSGLVALVRAQSSLWQQVDLSRDGARALREVHADLERLRGFSSVATTVTPPGGTPTPSWAGLGGASSTVVAAVPGDTALTLTRTVDLVPTDALKAVTTMGAWTDRLGRAQRIELSTLVAATDPRWGVWLSVAPGRPALVDSLTTPGLPPSAQAFGTHEAIWRPWHDAPLVWLFDRNTGEVQRRCEAPAGQALALLRPSDLRECQVLSGMLLAGTVRFATDRTSVDSRDAENPLGPALPLAFQLTAGAVASPPTWTCTSDAPDSLPADPRTTALAGARTLVHYACLVQPPGTSTWSGRLDLVPLQWTLATSATDTEETRFRVCRYSADQNGNGRIDNPEHPASYTLVAQALSDQNFLVVRASATCPVEAQTQRQWADDSTLAHQP